MKLYVEGGGDSKLLRTECRQGFSEFLRKAGLGGRMPRVVACGGRNQAYQDFCTAVAHGEPAMLLVDSEAPVAVAHAQGPMESWMPWLHLTETTGDPWTQPPDAQDMHCHLMVQCMESWFLADHAMLKAFFDPGFRASALPPSTGLIENLGKKQIYQSLASATSDCKTKAPYGKGPHSFKLLARVDPGKVTGASPWAHRFVEAIKQQMG